MNRIRYSGIPYLGVDNNSLLKKIFSQKDFRHKSITFYDFFNRIESNRYIAIIDGKWLSWCEDIQFNYRDGICQLPYFTYETYRLEKSPKNDNFGHLLISEDGKILVRYAYKLCKLKLEIGSELKIYDILKDKFYELEFSSWCSLTSYKIERLYELYRGSCYFDKRGISDVVKGYHFFTKDFVGFTNAEYRYRRKNGLETYLDDYEPIEDDYRDVRGYSLEQYSAKARVLVFNMKPYKYRRLSFDCTLFCIVKSGVSLDSEDYTNFIKSKEASYFKYGKDVFLIFKKYWYTGGNNSLIKKRFCSGGWL